MTDATTSDKLIAGTNILVKKIFIGPDTIFTGGVSLLNANIFEATTGVDPFQNTNLVGDSIDNIGTDLIYGSNFAGVIKKGIAGTYVILRNICAMIMLAGLLFTGIRILITSNTPSKMAQWRQLLQDWLVGMVLLIFSHVIMYGVFWMSDTITDALSDQLLGFGGLNFNLVKECILSFDSAVQIVCLVMLAYLIYLTIIFIIAYFKRLMWICVLIVIAPIVSTMYAFGNQTKRIYSNWLREYITTVLVQPFHLIVYYVLVSIPLNAVSGGSWEYTGANIFTTIYALGALSFIKPAEKYIRHLMQMDQGIAEQASFDSGKQTFDAAIDAFSDLVKKAVMIGGMVATGGATAPTVLSEVTTAETATGLASKEQMTDMVNSGDGQFLIESTPGNPTPTAPVEEDTLGAVGDTDPDLMLADAERGDIYGNFARDQFHDDYFAGDTNFDNDLQGAQNLLNGDMNEEELQEYLDNLGLEEGSEERSEMENNLRNYGHGKKQDSEENDYQKNVGDIDPDLMLADLERGDIYGNFARDQFHDDYFSGAEEFDNDLQNPQNMQNRKMNEEELQDMLDGLGLEEGSEERIEMEKEFRDNGHGDNESDKRSFENDRFIDKKLSEEELQKELDNQGLEEGSEKRAKMEEMYRALGHGMKMPEDIQFAEDKYKLPELEDLNLEKLQEQPDKSDLNLEKLQEKSNKSDLNEINASNVNINASNVGLNYNGDDERNKGNIERIDSTEDAKRTLEDGNKQEEITASEIKILASNVDLSYDKQAIEGNSVAKEEKVDSETEKSEESLSKEEINENGIDIEIKDNGKLYDQEPTEKDSFLRRRTKEFNAAVDFVKGETTIVGAYNKLSEDSWLRSMPGKVANSKTLQSVRDSETMEKLRDKKVIGSGIKKTEKLLENAPKFIKAFDEVGGFKDLHKGYHAVKDTFYVGGATEDWKKMNNRMEATIKTSQEQEVFKVVNDVKNQNYVIMKNDLLEKYRKQYKGKPEAYILNLAQKEAKEKLETAAKTYVPYGIKDAKIMLELEDDRKQYGLSPTQAIEQRINYEKFNINQNNVNQLSERYNVEYTSVQEAIPDARNYYNEGYVKVDDLIRVTELTERLGVSADYGKKLDKILQKKGPDVTLNLDRRKDISGKQKEDIKKFIEDNYVLNKGL